MIKLEPTRGLIKEEELGDLAFSPGVHQERSCEDLGRHPLSETWTTLAP